MNFDYTYESGFLPALRLSNFPLECFSAEIIIPGKDELKTGMLVNLYQGNFRWKGEIWVTFSARKDSAKFQAETFWTGNFPWKTH